MATLAEQVRAKAQTPTMADQVRQRAAAEREAGQPFLGAAEPEAILDPDLTPGRPPPQRPTTMPVKQVTAKTPDTPGFIEGAMSIIPSPQALLDVAIGTASVIDFGLAPRENRAQRILASQKRLEKGVNAIIGVVGATFEGALKAFSQGLQTIGVSQTEANRTVREAVRFLDFSSGFIGMAPASSIISKGREVRRAATGAEVRDRKFAELMQDREKMLMDRAENVADLSARRGARATAPVLASREQLQQLEDVAAARARTSTRQTVDDINANALQDDALLRDPDNILAEMPVFTQDVLSVPAVRKALATAEAGLRQRGLIGEGVSVTPEKVTKIAMDALSTGALKGSALAHDLNVAGVQQKDFIMMLGATSSQAGQTLREFRTFRDHLRTQALRGDEASQDMLRNMSDIAVENMRRRDMGLSPLGSRSNTGGLDLTPTEAAEPFFRQGGRLSRKLMVSLPSTAVRNFVESFGTRILLQTANRALDTGMKKMFRPSDPLIEPIHPLDEWWRATLSRSRSSDQMQRIFAAFPDVQHKLWSTLEADISMTKARNTGRFLDQVEAGTDAVLLWANRAQSKIVRGPIFAAQLDRNLRKIGVSLEDVVDYGKIPAGMEKAMADAMDLALYTDYTLTPKKGPLAKLMEGYSKMWDGLDAITHLPIGAVLEPFPRFMYNAIKLVSEQMPTAGLRLMRPDVRAQIAAGDYNALAREFTGTLVLATAYSARKGYIPGFTPGERWDEALGPDGTPISLAPYVVMAAPLFLADMAIRLEEGRMPVSFEAFRDLREGFLGSGPQLQQGNAVMQEALNSLLDLNSTASYQRFMEFASEKVSAGFLRPFQLIRDFGAEWDETWLIHRETRGQGVFAPAHEIWAPNQLPPRYLPTRSDPASIPEVPMPFTFGEGPKISGNIARHITGTIWRERRNAIENELAHQGFLPRDLSAKSGDPFLDNLIAKNQGPILEAVGELVVQSPAYLDLTNKTKREILRTLVNATREKAIDAANAEAPAAFQLRKFKRMPGLRREALFEIIDQLLDDRGEGLTVESVSEQVLGQLREMRAQEEQDAMKTPAKAPASAQPKEGPANAAR